jgi:hypothetical protein
MKLEVEIKDLNTDEVTKHEVGFIWGMGAFEVFEDNTGMDQVEMHQGVLLGKQKVLCNLAYAAAQVWWEMVKGEPDLPFTYRQFQLWLSEADKEIGQKISEDFKKSAYEGGTMESYYQSIVANMVAATKEEAKGAKKKSRSVKSS